MGQTAFDVSLDNKAVLKRTNRAPALRRIFASPDVLRTLVLASYLLGVDRAMVIAHTKCRMASGTEEDVHDAVADAGGPDTRSLSFLVTDDQVATLRGDVQRVRSWPYLARLQVGGFLYDVDTGRVSQVC